MSAKNIHEHVFTWKIQNFSFFFQENGESIKSPEFTVEQFGGSQWHLKLYPDGYKKEHDGFVSLYLHKTKKGVLSTACSLQYRVELMGNDGKTIERLESKKYVVGEDSMFGLNKLTTRWKLIQWMNDTLEDILTICCYMYVENSQCNRTETKACTEILLDNCSFLWNVEVDLLSSDLLSSNLLSSEELKKEISFSENSLYNIALFQFKDEIRIDIFRNHEISTGHKKFYGQISLIDANGRAIISKSARHSINLKWDSCGLWQFPLILSRKFLESNNHAFVENRTISLMCKFTASNGELSSSVFGAKTSEVGEKKKIDYHLALITELKRMLLNNLHSDVQIKTSNEIIQAHKSILSARSPVFAAMFRQDMIESQTNTVDMLDIESDILKSFLVFIYTGTIEKFDYEKAKSLILIADRYEVPTLTEKCTTFLKSILSKENVCELLSFADMINHEHLKKSTIDFIVENSTTVLELPEWSVLTDSCPKLAIEIYSQIVRLKK